MGEALSQGFSQMVGDLSGGALSLGQDEPGDSVSAVPESEASTPAPSLPPRDNRPQQRRIPMPAGFPNGGTNTSSALPTPGSNAQTTLPARQPGLSRTGSYLQTQTGRATSTAPSTGTSNHTGVNQDQHFRFRGQFASQPGTPGVEGERQRGVLNSRAR
jgi:maintenance of morphology protein 1